MNEEKKIIHYDALVVGGGNNRRRAALNLANTGYRVLLVEKERSLGRQDDPVKQGVPLPRLFRLHHTPRCRRSPTRTSPSSPRVR